MLSYQWKLYNDITIMDIESSSLDPRFFSIDAYTLDALSTYTITAVVTISDDTTNNPPSSEASLTFQLGSSAVIANIDEVAQTVTSSDVVLPKYELRC